MMIKHLKIAAVCCCIILLGACIKKKKDDFSRTDLLNNLYSNIILPDYQTFYTSAGVLKASADAFIASPDMAKLDSLKVAYTVAYKNFQAVETYDFSPASDLRNALNSFPPDTNQVNNNIATGSYNLNTANNIRAKGFPAVDFLLFGQSGIEAVSLFSTDANRKQYLTDIVDEINSKAASATSSWSAFQSSFVSASGTDVGSSVGMLVNDISFEMERNRRERVGNALGYIGIISGGMLAPSVVEAFYSSYSKELLIHNLEKLKVLFEGGSGTGFDDYLNHLNADYNGTPLATEISNQFDKAILAAQTVPVSYSAAVSTNNAEMQMLFLELKKLVVLLKVDMSSQLGVIINYSDNDGD